MTTTTTHPRKTTMRLATACCLVGLLAAVPAARAQEHPGQAAYEKVCATCHGPEGAGGLAPALAPLSYDADYVLAIVREGYGQMPPISARELSDEEVAQATEYLRAPGAVAEASAPAAAQEETAAEHPDLSGIWQAVNAASWNLEDHNAEDGVPAGLSVVVGGSIPYRDDALAQRQANYENRLADDPVRQCFLPGVPRIMYMPFPFQIIQTPDYMVMTFEFAHTVRIIYTDGSPHPLPNDFWMGDSRGHWEGDTLVIDTTHFNDQTWFDASGNFHSNQLHVVERLTPQGDNHIMYEATIEDPEVFTGALDDSHAALPAPGGEPPDPRLRLRRLLPRLADRGRRGAPVTSRRTRTMRTTIAVAALGLSLLLAPPPAVAHHAFSAEFDADRPLQLLGTVTRTEWINPHSWIHIDVEDDDGNVESWAIECGAPNALIRRGLNKNSVPAGTVLVVDGFGAKDGSNTANARDITLPDGSQFYVGSSGTGAPGQP